MKEIKKISSDEIKNSGESKLLDIYNNVVKNSPKLTSVKSPKKNNDQLKSTLVTCYEMLKIIRSLEKNHSSNPEIKKLKEKTKKIAKNLNSIFN